MLRGPAGDDELTDDQPRRETNDRAREEAAMWTAVLDGWISRRFAALPIGMVAYSAPQAGGYSRHRLSIFALSCRNIASTYDVCSSVARARL